MSKMSFHNFRLIVSVEEGIKTLIGPKIPNINDCITFEDLYKKVNYDLIKEKFELYRGIARWIFDFVRILMNIKSKIKQHF